MAQDFSKVVQQLQIANEKLARLERIQTEGGTAKGIIAASLPEVVNERQVFGQEKQFQKDQGVTQIDDEQKRTENLRKVEENYESPNEVWAVRAEELRTMDWKTWLKQVYLILKDVPMGDLANLESEGAHEALKKIDSIISQLASTEETQNGNA